LAGCGGSDKKSDAADKTSGTGGSTASTGDEPGGEVGGSDGSTGVKIKPKGCGDKTVAAPEECDDGNNIEDDGCDSNCIFNCKSDTDCAGEKDVCSGSGLKCDTGTNKCVAGTDKAANDTKCGDNSWCYEGKCYALECNNGIKQGNEECDDGNDDDADGCTKKCTYTCGSSVGAKIALNLCDYASKCDEKTHTWIKGSPMADNTSCNRGAGYCLNGVCVYSICGDGVKQPNEACDSGPSNGKEGCSKTCTIGTCGNNQIETGEECDDGNTTNVDGCDFRCKAEVTMRATSLKVSTEDAPAPCFYAKTPNKGNAFKKLFPVDANTGTNAILDLINSAITGAMTTGEIITIFQSFDIDDYSGFVPAPSAFIGISIGKSQDTWPTDTTPASTLDIPLLAYKNFFGEDNQPKDNFPCETVMLNDVPTVRSTAPFVAGFDIWGMYWGLSNLVAYIPVDKPFTPLKGPAKKYADTLKIPETLGGTAADNPPSAYLCGGFTTKSFGSIPLMDMLATICVDEFLNSTLTGKPTYVACTEENSRKQLKEGRCDSFLTVFQGGCHALGITILNPIGEPDVDVNNDGTNDAYSAVVRVSVQRAQLVGLTDPPDGGTAQ